MNTHYWEPAGQPMKSSWGETPSRATGFSPGEAGPLLPAQVQTDDECMRLAECVRRGERILRQWETRATMPTTVTGGMSYPSPGAAHPAGQADSGSMTPWIFGGLIGAAAGFAACKLLK